MCDDVCHYYLIFFFSSPPPPFSPAYRHYLIFSRSLKISSPSVHMTFLPPQCKKRKNINLREIFVLFSVMDKTVPSLLLLLFYRDFSKLPSIDLFDWDLPHKVVFTFAFARFIFVCLHDQISSDQRHRKQMRPTIVLLVSNLLLAHHRSMLLLLSHLL